MNSSRGDDDFSTSQFRSISEVSDLHAHYLRSSSSDVQVLIDTNTSTLYEGERLPSLIASRCSSRGSVVPSLNDNFIAVRDTKVGAHHRSTSSEASSAYVDHCGWTDASIDANTADARHAIQPARGTKRTALGKQPLQPEGVDPRLGTAHGSVRNPFAKPGPVGTLPSRPQRNLADVGRKHSVRVYAPPDPSALPRNAAAQPPPPHERDRSSGATPQQLAEMQAQNGRRKMQLRQPQPQERFMQVHCLQQQQQYQQQQRQQRFDLPAPLSETLSNEAQHSQVPPCANPRTATTNSMNDSAGLSSSLSPSRTKVQGNAVSKKRHFWFCGGAKGDVAPHNRCGSWVSN
ncbi:hypothetical protein ABB37_05859 [Leptomonas pyrrhocoris]|uniref:Uncharacterized protein n=1 Tax=Leptomonas pyrrhocoris TaxID=157538 RepID=A0A0M9FYU2_LEPPY|nr:hypothetical protein ABB37_05859 [Leptomonas pyrrhocoris]KPA78737.1 hypothetical protein ABB37_05859 [Leptomonas pyrrhocoris]|eukprot:XP_015657176.1 hypothetical protein ABB37_05859 [Leptomonas pyrrhocoris]